MNVLEAVRGQANENTKYHCVYGYFHQGMRVKQLAKLYHKSIATVHRWIQLYMSGKPLSRKKPDRKLHFDYGHRLWIVRFFEKYPTSYLKECQQAFIRHFQLDISVSSIWAIIHDAGLTLKKLERRALEIKLSDVARFTIEMNNIPWCKLNLLFLDEVSFDTRGMIRKEGYGIKGKRLVFRGEFNRKPRISHLSFLSVNGLVETFETENTFNRANFMRSCKSMAEKNNKIFQYPGKCSVWVMDGAKIHTDENLVHLLRSFGIIIVFLPAYCPFFNPIELFFGMVKQEFKRFYREGQTKNLSLFVSSIMQQYNSHDSRQIFTLGFRIRIKICNLQLATHRRSLPNG